MTIATQNEDWGFYGAMAHHADPAEAWDIAFPAVASASGSSEEAVRDFLDSRWGRHFADDVANGLAAGQRLPAAIAGAVARWMGWRTGKCEERDYQIPRGLPMMVGLVWYFEVVEAA